jgi:lysozyme
MSSEVFMLMCKNQLIKHEGLVLNPYKCTSGALTIGVGRNLDARGISKAEAMFMLDNDLNDCISQLQTHLGDIYLRLNDTRKLVLVNMCFNLGIFGLLQFRKTIAYLRVKEYNNAAKEMLDSKWAKQVGNRAKELAEMMRKG